MGRRGPSQVALVVRSRTYPSGLGAGVLQFTPAASVSSQDTQLLALSLVTPGCPRGPSRLLPDALLISLVGAPRPFGLRQPLSPPQGPALS